MKESLATLVTLVFVGVVGCATLGGTPMPNAGEVCNPANVGAEVVDVDKAVRICKIDYGLDVAMSNGEAVLFWINSMAARNRVGPEFVGKALDVASKFKDASVVVETALDNELPGDALTALVQLNKILLELEQLKDEVPQ